MKLYITGNLSAWWAGIERLDDVAAEEGKEQARRAMEEVVEEARANAHVITGDLAASGRVEEIDVGGEYEVAAVFGDDFELGYASFEETLHPYLTPAAMRVLGGQTELTITAG